MKILAKNCKHLPFKIYQPFLKHKHFLNLSTTKMGTFYEIPEHFLNCKQYLKIRTFSGTPNNISNF
jgi:hypothetical protein